MEILQNELIWIEDIKNKFLADKLLSMAELSTLKTYLIRLFDGMPIKPRHYKFRLDNMNQKDLMRYIEELAEMGIYPWSQEIK